MPGQGSCTGTVQHFMKHWQARPGESPIVGATIWLLVRSLARSLASRSPSLLHCHHPRIWQWCEGTPMYASYETLFRDRQGRQNWDAEGRLVDGKKNGLTCLLLNPHTNFSFVLERKIHHVRVICTHTLVYSVDFSCCDYRDYKGLQRYGSKT